MKTTLIASAIIACSVAISGNALAQRNDHGNDHNDRNDRNANAQQQNNGRYDNDRHDNAQQQNNDRHDNGRMDDARKYRRDDNRGGGPRHDLRRGQRLSQEYRDNRYVVNDWQARHLSAPPRGHHWVRAGNDYVLAAIATGVIAQILLSN
jgi:Ni/Co efflux regulator RcnB